MKRIKKHNYLKLITVIVFLAIWSPMVLAIPGAGGAPGSGSGTGGTGGNATSPIVNGAGGGGGGGSTGAGGNGGNGAGGTLVLKNTSGSMSTSGTIDTRGGGSSATNGGTVKLFYTGSVPSTTGVTSGRTYTALATSQLSQVCVTSASSSNSSNGSTINWTSGTNAHTQDGLYASSAATSPSNQTSRYLVLTGCNFSIPQGSSITGVRADFYRYNTPAPQGLATTDSSLVLVVGNVLQSTNLGAGSNVWASSVQWDTYGSSTNLWGATLTSSQVNSPNFGVAIAAANHWSPADLSGSTAFIDSTHITVYYTPNSSPAGPVLSVPSNSATGLSGLPTFQMRAADADSDYLKYKIELCQDISCGTVLQTIDQTTSQTGWSGQDINSATAYSGSPTVTSSTMATYTVQSVLSPATTYYWRAYAIDPGGSNTFGTASGIQSFTTGNSPSGMTLLAPASGAIGTSTNPLFQMRSTDAEGDYLRYKILIYSSDCSTGLQTFDQTTSQVGWTGQDLQTGTAYTGSSVLNSSAIATYGQTNLSPTTQYCWKAAAIDPAGSNVFGPYSPTQLFTTGVANPGTVNITGGSTVQGGAYVR